MADLAVRTGVFAALGVLALPARGAQATRGEAVQVDWRVAYERQVRGSPFKPGGPWHPLCPGKLECVLFSLCGRTPETPKEIVTPFDICREVRGE